MGQALYLRKLTEKSFMNFGKNRDFTVQNLLDLKRYQYLRWVYFNSSNITFMDNILKTIGVKKQFKIPKPGVNRELGDAINEWHLSFINGLEKHILNKKKRSQLKGNSGAYFRRDKIKYSKGNLQAFNQGR